MLREPARESQETYFFRDLLIAFVDLSFFNLCELECVNKVAIPCLSPWFCHYCAGYRINWPWGGPQDIWQRLSLVTSGFRPPSTLGQPIFFPCFVHIYSLRHLIYCPLVWLFSPYVLGYFHSLFSPLYFAHRFPISCRVQPMHSPPIPIQCSVSANAHVPPMFCLYTPSSIGDIIEEHFRMISDL